MKRPWIVISLVTLASLGLELTLQGTKHPIYWWHHFPGFDFAYGLAGCITIVLLSKWLGTFFIQRPDSYYGDDRV